MNIYKFELKNTYKSIIINTLFGALFLLLFTVTIYPVFSESKSDLQAVLDGFPPEFSAIFMGSTLDDLFSYAGFYGFCFMYLSIMGAYFAAALGLNIFAREKRAKCMDFLMTKPLSRNNVFLQKLFTGLSGIAVYNIVYIVFGVMISTGTQQDMPLKNSIWGHCAMLFLQLMFFAAGTFVAVFLKKIRSVSGTALCISLGAFILSMLYHLTEEGKLRYLSVYDYFDTSLAFKNGTYETPFVVLAILIIAALIAASFVKFCKSDVHAV